MSIKSILSGTEISASGLASERLRMEVAANNIANLHSTRTPEGGPYQRQVITFASAMKDQVMTPGGHVDGAIRGVQVVGVTSDSSPGPLVHDPGHPDADANGDVRMPNVNMSHEMVDMLTASRAYEANLKAMESFRQMAEQSLSLLRGLR
jgi:flagellar basal-body rod protein FlgC